MSESMNCCRCCTSFIFTLGLTSLFLWLSLRPSKPTFSIQRFYVPALNTTAGTNTTTNNTNVTIVFKIQNNNKDKRVYYDALIINLYYQDQSSPVGNTSVTEFRQGHKKTAIKQAIVEGVKILWEAAVKNVSSNGTVRFTVDLVTHVRYEIIFWKTKRKKILFHKDVIVDKQGKSAASDRSSHRHCFSGVFAFIFVLLTI